MLFDGVSLIPNIGIQTQKIPPIISVKDKRVNSAAGKDLDPMIIAYEPVWAIGTGVNALPSQVEESHAMIWEILLELYDNNIKNNIPILYGGNSLIKGPTELMSIFGSILRESE